MKDGNGDNGPGNVLGKGNIFDPIYNGQKNWRKFYKACADDQYEKVKDYN